MKDTGLTEPYWCCAGCFAFPADYVRSDGYVASGREVRRRMVKLARQQGLVPLNGMMRAEQRELEEAVLADYDRRIAEGSHRRRRKRTA